MDYESNIDWLLEFQDLYDPVWAMHSTDKYTFNNDPMSKLGRDQGIAGGPNIGYYRMAHVTAAGLWAVMFSIEEVRDLTVRSFSKVANDWPVGLRKTRREIVMPVKIDYSAITRSIVGRP